MATTGLLYASLRLPLRRQRDERRLWKRLAAAEIASHVMAANECATQHHSWGFSILGRANPQRIQTPRLYSPALTHSLSRSPVLPTRTRPLYLSVAMQSTPFPRAALFLALALASCSCSLVSDQAEPGQSPNVILVMTDDQGYGEIHSHGNAMIRTPHLDRLRQMSVRFTNFHVDPTCSPTRSALMSGRYSTRTGVWHTIMGRSLMAPEEWTVAEELSSDGYRTAMFGKWHLGENFPLRPQDQGFDEVLCHGGGGVTQAPDYWDNDYFDDTYWRNGTPEKFKGYCTDVWFQEAMQFIGQNRDRPFFCYLSTNAPHGPFLVDKKWSQPYVDRGVAETQAAYYGMIENADWNMGRLMAHLDKLGLTDNTILIFMTDNGTAGPGRVDMKRVKAGKWGGFDGGMRGAKGSEYEGGHRVPFFVRWPAGGIGGVGKGRDESYLAAHIDVLPTLSTLCGLNQSQRASRPSLDGISLADRMRNGDAAMPDRTLVVHSQRIKQPEKWRKSAVMTSRWRLVNGKELYDVDKDPKQTQDLATANPDVVTQLTKAYDAWWESLQPSMARSVRIGIGSAAEPTTVLHAHDWQVLGNKGCPWHQNHIRRGLMLHGEWFVDVQETGRYQIEFCRWPRHLNKAIEAKKATLMLDATSQHQDLKADATKAVFEVSLNKGPLTLRSILTNPDGQTRGAYFVYVTKVSK